MIRTSDLSVPNRALYQAEPRPEKKLQAFHSRNTFKCRILQAKKPLVKLKRCKCVQISHYFFNCPRSMANFALNGGRKFAKCFRKAVGNENRVITEAVRAARIFGDFPLANS